MMGGCVGRQDRLSYDFDLEDMVPADHLLRRIDAVDRLLLFDPLGTAVVPGGEGELDLPLVLRPGS